MNDPIELNKYLKLQREAAIAQVAHTPTDIAAAPKVTQTPHREVLDVETLQPPRKDKGKRRVSFDLTLQTSEESEMDSEEMETLLTTPRREATSAYTILPTDARGVSVGYRKESRR